MLPGSFALNVVEVSDSPTDNYFQIHLNPDLTQNRLVKLIFQFYEIAIAFFEGIFPIMSLTVMNIISIRKFKRIMKDKREMSEGKGLMTEKRRFEKADIRFTKLIILLTFIQILTRLFDCIISILLRIKYIENIRIDVSDSLIFFLREVSSILLISAHSFDGVLYFLYDTQVKRVLIRIFRCSQRQQDKPQIEN